VFHSADLIVARRVASRILTLPLYSDLEIEQVDRICDMVEYFHSHARLRVAKLVDELTAEVAVGA
jgi:dTDP-4-amino-4,6-dideoxygalactose transaminase